MRVLICLTLILAAYLPSFAQNEEVHIRNKWCTSKDSLVLFKDGYNVIQVYGAGLKPTDLKLKSLDKSMRIGVPEVKGDTISVMAMPFPDKGKTMRLAVLSSKTSKQLKVAEFRCDVIPNPSAKIGSLSGGDTKKKDLLAQSVMKVVFPRSLYAYPYSIKQYTFKVSTAKGSAVIPVKGFFLTNEVLKEINAAPEGTVVEFTDIVATCPECKPHPVESVKIRLR